MLVSWIRTQPGHLAGDPAALAILTVLRYGESESSRAGTCPIAGTALGGVANN